MWSTPGNSERDETILSGVSPASSGSSERVRRLLLSPAKRTVMQPTCRAHHMSLRMSLPMYTTSLESIPRDCSEASGPANRPASGFARRCSQENAASSRSNPKSVSDAPEECREEHWRVELGVRNDSERDVFESEPAKQIPRTGHWPYRVDLGLERYREPLHVDRSRVELRRSELVQHGAPDRQNVYLGMWKSRQPASACSRSNCLRVRKSHDPAGFTREAATRRRSRTRRGTRARASRSRPSRRLRRRI